jgi:FkbM family methyltransferase
MTLTETHIHSAGRKLTMAGTAAQYLQSYSGWNADKSVLITTTGDLSKGATVLDIGANIGMISCSLAVRRPDLRIIAVEPVPQNVECLRKNIVSNGIKNVHVVHAAASSRRGSINVNVNGPWSVVVENGEATVPAVTLDDFIADAPAFIKIDVEGWEPHVIAGGPEMLSSLRPKVLMEFNTWALLAQRHDPISFATALWDAFDHLDQFAGEEAKGAPRSDKQIVHDNVAFFRSVTDILLRPKSGKQIPTLEEMIYTPLHRAALRSLAKAV